MHAAGGSIWQLAFGAAAGRPESSNQTDAVQQPSHHNPQVSANADGWRALAAAACCPPGRSSLTWYLVPAV